MDPQLLEEIISNFQFEGTLTEWKNYGNGHINDTLLLSFQKESGEEYQIVLQHMNQHIFKQPVQLMENVLNVTTYLRKHIEEHGGDPDRETLHFVIDREGLPYYCDSNGEYWRAYRYIDNVDCYDLVEEPEDFYQSGIAFGSFQRRLADYPAESLHEIIEGFHDTRARFKVFQQAVAEDVCGRAKDVQKEIQFVLDHEELANVFAELLDKKELPLRVTHNDTKLNNVLIDKDTRKGICVIDLDTVMPGLAMNDFGDAIRFGASTALEDEPDLEKVSCSMELYEAFTKGFMEGCCGRLTEKEIDFMPMGAKVMTYECGMRFLTDYLQGDVYFKTHREGHNLDRCRTQFKLVEDMEQKWNTMCEIVQKFK